MYVLCAADPYHAGNLRWSKAISREIALPRPGKPTMAHPEHLASTTGTLCAQRERMVKQLILANLGESLEVMELARACALSRSHFSRVFKSTTGLSPREWIRRQRIQRAKVLIAGSELSLTQIGQECGFCDQAHFSHMFSRSEGVNPMTWRHRQLRYRHQLRKIQIATVNFSETVIQFSAS